MTRFAYAAAQSASTEQTVQFRVLASVAMVSTTALLCTGMTPVTWAANTYQPVGMLGGIEKVQEDASPFPRTLRLWLSAVGSAQLADALTENLFNKQVKLYRTFLNQQGLVVSTPEMMFSGRINDVKLNLRDPTKGSHIALEVESRLRREPRSAWFNKETLWQTYSGDTFFNFIEQIPGFRALWGNKATYFNAPWNSPGFPGGLPHFPFRR